MQNAGTASCLGLLQHRMLETAALPSCQVCGVEPLLQLGLGGGMLTCGRAAAAAGSWRCSIAAGNAMPRCPLKVGLLLRWAIVEWSDPRI